MVFLYAVLWSGLSALVFLGTLVCVLVRRQRVHTPETVPAQSLLLRKTEKEVNLGIWVRL
jgi:hypothetical protein